MVVHNHMVVHSPKVVHRLKVVLGSVPVTGLGTSGSHFGEAASYLYRVIAVLFVALKCKIGPAELVIA